MKMTSVVVVWLGCDVLESRVATFGALFVAAPHAGCTERMPDRTGRGKACARSVLFFKSLLF